MKCTSPNGQCRCKDLVEGPQCNVCEDMYYGLLFNETADGSDLGICKRMCILFHCRICTRTLTEFINLHRSGTPPGGLPVSKQSYNLVHILTMLENEFHFITLTILFVGIGPTYKYVFILT